MYWINGDKYEGDQKNYLKDGKGIIYWIDGGRYVLEKFNIYNF